MMNGTETLSHRLPGRSARRSAGRLGRAAPVALARRILLVALAVAAVVTLNAISAAGDHAGKTAVVIDSSVAHDPARLAAAQEWLRRSGPAGAAAVAPRVPARATRGYDTIVAIGLDPRVAIDPVVQRNADVRVVRWPGA